MALEAILLRGAVARWSYNLGFHGKLRVTTHEVRLAQESPLPRPLVLAFASDFHAGITTHPELFSNLILELTRQSPDVLLLGGDFVDSKSADVDVLVSRFSKFKPPLGKYAVLGNHDLYDNSEHIATRLTAAEIEVLVNRNVPLPPPFDGVSICGIDDPWLGNPDAERAFDGAAPVRIFLSHSPDGLLVLNGNRFGLGFAGHTHGGQVVLPGGTVIVSPAGPLSRTYLWGRFESAQNGPLIVSRGIGCSMFPIRINCDPELVICKLYP